MSISTHPQRVWTKPPFKKRLKMKAIKFAHLLAFAIAISFGSVGCKTHNTPPITKFDENGKPITGDTREPGGGGKVGEESGIGKTPGTEGIAMGNGHPGW